MKVPTGEHFALLAEHKRVICAGISLHLKRVHIVYKAVLSGSMNCRYAPKGVSILHPIAIVMTLPDLRGRPEKPQ
jgi:hypothetical protein